MSVNLEQLKILSQQQIFELIDPVFISTWNTYFKNPDSLFVIPVGNNSYGYVIKTCLNRCEDIEIGNFVSYEYSEDEIDFLNTNRSICRIDIIHQKQVKLSNNIPEKELINIDQSKKTKPKPKQNCSIKKIERDFCSAYADAKMIKLTQEEFGAMKYYESLMQSLKYRKKGKTLKDKMDDFFKKYPNVTETRIKSIYATRINHFRYGKIKFQELVCNKGENEHQDELVCNKGENENQDE